MKNLIQRSLATVGTAAFLALNALTPAHAGFVFEETELNPDSVVAIAQPLNTQGYQGYKLLVLEQQKDTRPCWSEMGAQVGPVAVSPLLLDFDFSGICGRATDSNGYSARINDTDLALTHNLSLQEIGGDVKLFAVSRTGEKILIGSTHGVSDDFLKIDLKPGWRFTKRTYGDKVLGHFYLSNDNYIAANVEEENTDEVAVDIEVPEVIEEEVAEEVTNEEEVAEEVTNEEEVAEEVTDEEVAEEVTDEVDEDAIAQLPDEDEEEEEEEEEEVTQLNSNTWKQFLEMFRQSVK